MPGFRLRSITDETMRRRPARNRFPARPMRPRAAAHRAVCCRTLWRCARRRGGPVSRRVMVLAADPALEVSYELDRVDWAGPNRPATTAERPGGRGLTVARFLHALGAEVRLMGLLGGPAGQAVADAMAAAGVPGSFVPTSEPTRRTFTVTDTGRGQSAHFSEPGPVASPAEYAILRQRYEEEVPPAAIVLAGRMPLSLPPGAGRELALLAVAAGVPVVAALDGPALWESTAAKPDVLTTDLAGLEAAAGRPLLDGGPPAVLAAARELRTAGARATVIWLGPRGALALTPDGIWRASPPAGIAGTLD